MVSAQQAGREGSVREVCCSNAAEFSAYMYRALIEGFAREGRCSTRRSFSDMQKRRR